MKEEHLLITTHVYHRIVPGERLISQERTFVVRGKNLSDKRRVLLHLQRYVRYYMPELCFCGEAPYIKQEFLACRALSAHEVLEFLARPPKHIRLVTL